MNIHTLFGIISPIFRRRRMRQFKEAARPAAGETLLDVGGTDRFWAGSGIDSSVTLLNIHSPSVTDVAVANIAYLQGDGCALP